MTPLSTLILAACMAVLSKGSSCREQHAPLFNYGIMGNNMLTLDAIRALRSVEALADLYTALGYPSDASPESFNSVDARLDGAAAQDAHQVYIVSDHGDLQHIHIVVPDTGRSTTRRIAEQFLRRSGQYLLSFSQADWKSVVFVKPYKLEGISRFGRLVVQPSHPTAHDLSVLREIAATPHLSGETLHALQVKAFNVERVTNLFYTEYHDLFIHLRDAIRAGNPYAVVRETPRKTVEDTPTLHAFTQRLLGRVIFLYFIQKKGWLDGKADFIRRLYSETVSTPGANFYRDALEKLFFEVLSTPRPGNTSPFGDVPYLNGSLFEREYPLETVLNLPNALFDPNVSGSLLHLLENYNFTIEESSSLDQDVSLDPEMLGKVFENMMEEEEAAKSGTFYTPRSIVQFLAEESLTRYLADAAEVPQERLLPLCAEGDEPGDLTSDEARRVRDALGRVRVLDPAVGTASMLVGMLAAMIRVRRSLERRLGIVVTPGSPALGQWKREYIQHCLYGVDIKHEAIEIARLRLWLSLVVDATEPEPLPNLDYKLMAGDGLLETVDGTPFLKAEQGLLGGTDEISAKALEIERLHEHFFRASQDPERRRTLRAEIQRLERELFRADVDTRIRGLDSRITLLRRQIAEPHRGERARATLVSSHTALSENLERLIEQRVKVWDEGEPLPFFLHGVHFAEVMRVQGGFDIVIGNPPYVSIGDLPAEYKPALKTAFPEVAAGRADLYVYFFQKALNLLRDGGRLAFITSNKFARAVYGKKLRGVLSAQTRLEMLIDFGDLPVFDATTYPFITLTRKASPDGSAVQMLPERVLKASMIDAIKGGLPRVRDSLSTFHEYARTLTAPIAAGEFSSSEWTLDNPLVLKLLSKLKKYGTPISRYLKGRISAGIKTGLNSAFILGPEKFKEISSDGVSGEALRPYIRGKFVKANKIGWAGEYIIVIPKNADIDMYPNLLRHLGDYRIALENRATARSHKWYELQQPQTAFHKSYEGPKIIYPDISQVPRFAFDSDGVFPDMTLFCIPIQENQTWLTAILNSRLIFFFIMSISPSVMGQSFRFKTNYIQQIPIDTPTPTQQAILGSISDDSRLDEINAVVYEMYGLTSDEIALVESRTAEAYASSSLDVQPEDEAEGDYDVEADDE